MSDCIILNCLTRDHELIDIEIVDGTIERIVPAGDGDLEAYDKADRYDAGERLVSPPLVEIHTHTNKGLTLSMGDKDRNREGTLLQAVSADRKERAQINDKAKIKQKARRLLTWYISAGVTRVRSHLGVYEDSETPFAHVEAMLDLKEEFSGMLDIQLVGMPSRGFAHDELLYDQFEEMFDRGVDVVGGAPNGEDTREVGVEHIEAALDLADRKGRLVDMHIDETDDPDARMTEVLAHKAKQYSMGSDVTASHVTALHSQPDAYADKLCRLLVESNLSVVTNPRVNAVLQGRYDDYPRRRGHTRVDELADAGVTVGVGQDNIGDLYNPYGDGDPISNLNFFAQYAHLNRLEDVDYLWDMVTHNNAAIYGLDASEYGLAEGNEGSLVVYEAKNPLEAIRNTASRALVVNDGNPIAKTEKTMTLLTDTGEQEIDFSTDFE